MSATGSESLRSSFSPSKPCVEHNVSESEMNMGIKKRKVNFSTPVVMKKKRMTGNALSYKANFKRQRREEIVPVELALGQTEKLTSYQEKEQVNSKEGCLKKMHKQGSLNTINSGGDHLVAGKNINQETAIVNEQRPPSSSLKLENSKRKIVKDSAKEEHNENQILSQQKQAVNDKGEGSQIDCLQKDSVNEEHTENQILSEKKQAVNDKGEESSVHRLRNKIQKNCHKRMAKLLQKQREQSQKFCQIWEKKKSDLERDYKLERSTIRSIHGEGAIRNNKLKLLDGIFTKKMEEHDLLKDVELKKLETEQLSAKYEEIQKEARWLAACRSGEPPADHGPESLALHSEEVGRDVPFGNSSNTLSIDPPNELGEAFSQTSVPAGVKQLDQLKNSGGRQIVCALPASKKSVPGEIGVVKLNEEVPPEVPETGEYANPVELSNNTSNKGIDKGDAIGLPDGLVNMGDGNDEAVDLPLVEQIVEPSEQTKASWTPHHCTLVLPQESEDQIPCSSISDVIQDIGAWVVEAQNTSPFEVTIVQSNIELQDQNVPEIESHITSEIAATCITDTVTPEESIVKLQGQNAPVLEDQYTLQIENANLEVIGSVNPVQDQSAQVVEKQKDSPFEVAASVHVDTVTVAQPNIELHDQDAPDTDTIEIAHEVFSENFQNQDASVLEDQATSPVEVANSEPVDIAPAIQNCEELVPIDVSPCCNHPPSIGVESQSQNLERSSSQSTQTALIADFVVVSHESGSKLGGPWEIQSNHLDKGSDSQFNLERNSHPTVEITDTVQLSSDTTSQLCEYREPLNNHFDMGSESQVTHNVDVSQIVVNTVELPHQAGLQLGSVGNLYTSGNQFSRYQVTSFSSPPLYAAPLQHELVKNSKEIEQLQKSHADLKSQLKSDHEKEIREFLAQINSKYDLKHQEAEAEYSYKKNGLDKNRSKILMNKLLADGFAAACGDLCRLRGIRQAASSSIMQYFQH